MSDDLVKQMRDLCQQIEAAARLARVIAIEVRKDGKDEWKCPINYTGCTKNCGSYGCGN